MEIMIEKEPRNRLPDLVGAVSKDPKQVEMSSFQYPPLA